MNYCKDNPDRIQLYLEGGLHGDDLHEFEEHLTECPVCSKELTQMRAVFSNLAVIPEYMPSPEFTDGVLSRISAEFGFKRAVQAAAAMPQAKLSFWQKLKKLKHPLWIPAFAGSAVVIFFSIKIVLDFIFSKFSSLSKTYIGMYKNSFESLSVFYKFFKWLDDLAKIFEKICNIFLNLDRYLFLNINYSALFSFILTTMFVFIILAKFVSRSGKEDHFMPYRGQINRIASFVIQLTLIMALTGLIFFIHQLRLDASEIRITKDKVYIDGHAMDPDSIDKIIGKDKHGKIKVSVGKSDSSGEFSVIEESEDNDEEDSETDDDGKRGEVVRFGSDVEVKEGERVEGGVVVFGGDAIVDGTVEGDIVVFGGSLSLGESAKVFGDAVVFGGKIEKEDGCIISGEEVNFGLGKFSLPKIGVFSIFRYFFHPLMVYSIILVIVIITIYLFRNNVQRVSSAVQSDFIKAGLIGFLGEICIIGGLLLGGILNVVFIIMTLGIGLLLMPLSLLILFGIILAIILSFITGYSGFAVMAGRSFAGKFRILRSMESAVAFGILGFFLIEFCSLLADLFSKQGFNISLLDWLFTFFSGVIGYIALTVGLGGMIMTKFGFRDKKAGKSPRRFDEPPPPPPSPSPQPDQQFPEKVDGIE